MNAINYKKRSGWYGRATASTNNARIKGREDGGRGEGAYFLEYDGR